MKIILATDGTTHSRAAADALGQYHLGEGDSIHVISVVDLGVPMGVEILGGYMPNIPETEQAAGETAQTVVTETVELLGKIVGVKISGEVLHGTPESRIVEAAKDFGADLIVIGSHGSGALERLLLGSVSDSVVHHAHCSVLIVRSK